MKHFLFTLMIGLFLLVGCDKTVYHADSSGGNSGVSIDGDSEIDTNAPVDTNETTEVNNTTILEKEVQHEENAKEWYVRLVVEDTTNNLISTDAQLGELDAVDMSNHVLKAIAPFTSQYLDVVFVNPVGVDAGEYKSDFHIASTDADVWEFTVKSFDSSATLILSWRGLYVLESYTDAQGRTRYHEHRSRINPLLNYMTLYDVTSGIEVDVLNNGSATEYVFDMNGSTERVFKWKVKDSSVVVQPKFTSFSKVVAKPLTQTQKLKNLQVKALRKDAKATPTRLRLNRIRATDMRKPPYFKVIGQ